MQRALSLPICRRISLSQAIRSSSTVSSAAFTSFFFSNDQWADQKSMRRFNNAAEFQSGTSETSGGRPPVDLAVYKPAEALTAKNLLNVYMQLSKSRLTVLNVLVAMSGVALSPLPATVPVLFATAIGTTLCSASANALNQIEEVPLDAQMTRTRMRPLVRRAISPVHAAGFAVVTGVTGPVILFAFLNPLTACLGLGNIILYAGAYTWMKRKTIYNTWVGSVVGAIPPLMGWTACGGHLIPSASYPIHLFLPPFLTSVSTPVDLSLIDNPLAPFAFFMLMFSWQFPHFMSLSYIVRGSYAQAGYRMLAVFDPTKNAIVAFRHAALLIPICSILIPLSGLTTWAFALTSFVPNVICTRAAWKFSREGGEKQARVAWRHSLWYLPAVLGLMMFHKQGMNWQRWLGITQEEPEENDDRMV